MAKLFLPKPDPYDLDSREYWRRNAGKPPWEGEVKAALKIAEGWASEWFEVAEVEAWLAVWPGALPKVAAGFKRAGISPSEAMTRLWYGRINTGRPRLAEQVAAGHITLDDAIQQFCAFRQKNGLAS